MNNIQKIRKQKKMSQTELAKILHTTQHQISKYENEIQEPTASVIVAIAKALNCTIDELLKEEV